MPEVRGPWIFLFPVFSEKTWSPEIAESSNRLWYVFFETNKVFSLRTEEDMQLPPLVPAHNTGSKAELCILSFRNTLWQSLFPCLFRGFSPEKNLFSAQAFRWRTHLHFLQRELFHRLFQHYVDHYPIIRAQNLVFIKEQTASDLILRPDINDLPINSLLRKQKRPGVPCSWRPPKAGLYFRPCLQCFLSTPSSVEGRRTISCHL